MKYEITKLENGAKIIGVNMPEAKSVVINFGFKTGSRNEELKYAGISHFLEHMVFKGSKKRPTAAEISRAADEIGAIYNAATEKEWTYYYIHSAKENFDLALDVVGDMVTNPQLEQKELEKEAGTIVEEIRMYRDTPIIEIGWKMEETIFGVDTPLGRDEGGTEESVKRIDANVMREYYQTHYTGGNCVVVVSGNLPLDYVEKIKPYLANLKPGKSEFVKQESLESNKLRLIHKDTEQAHLGICLPEYSVNDQRKYAAKVAAVIFGGNMSSRLFTEIRERRGLAYSINASSKKYSDTGLFEIIGGIRKEKIEEAIQIIKQEVLEFSKTVTEDELKRAKGFLEGVYAIRFDDPEARTDFTILQHLLSENPETPEEYLEKIAEVQLADVKEVANNLFALDQIYVTVMGPFKDEEKFAKILAEK